MKNIDKFIHFLGKNKHIKKTFSRLFPFKLNQYRRRMLGQEQEFEDFQKYALEALEAFCECMDKNNYSYTLFGGSMLGAIREKGFIKHDPDMDTAMWIDDYSPKIIEDLKDYGFSLYIDYEVDNGKYGKEFVFVYKGIKGVRIDIFFIYPAIDKFPYFCDFVYKSYMKPKQRLPRRKEFPAMKGRKKVLFENKIEVYIPQNAEELCEYFYGKNYMKPDPNWDWVNDGKQYIVEWKEMMDKTTCEHK